MFFRKSQYRKKLKRGTLGSLGQIIQFGTMKLCRTSKNYFRQFVWIEKKVTIIGAFHFMKRRLKTFPAFFISVRNWFLVDADYSTGFFQRPTTFLFIFKNQRRQILLSL